MVTGSTMRRLRLGLLGTGNIAQQLRAEIERSRSYDVVGSWGRDDKIALAGIDLVVEVATPEAVQERLLGVIAAGVDALVLSVGALVEPEVRAALAAGPGRTVISTGAIGGLDHLRALSVAGELSAITIETRKLPATLVQPWMDEAMTERLYRGDEEILLLESDAATVARAFPRSANVAASVALATDGWEITRARVIADPAARLTSHVITAQSPLGGCRFEVHNAPSPDRPRSSAVVVPAVLRGIDDYAAAGSFDAPVGLRFG